MTTVITKPVAREVPYRVRTPKATRPIIATLTVDGIALRAKGTRTTYVLPYGTARIRAAQLAAAAAAADRKAIRAARKLTRG